jgi:hypothetical protein
MTRLDELDANEFYDVYREFRPGATREEFQAAWDRFQLAKAERQHRTAMQ